MIGAEQLHISAGRDGIEWGIGDETPHGQLHIWRVDATQGITNSETYSVPAGTVRIAHVVGTRITLLPVDPDLAQPAFVFDTAQRRWVAPRFLNQPQAPVAMEDCSYAPGLISCWNLSTPTHPLYLFAGGDVDATGAPEGRLILASGNDLMHDATIRTEIYETPIKAGAVRITAIDGTRVTVVTNDPRFPLSHLQFDLASRQWLSVAIVLPATGGLSGLIPSAWAIGLLLLYCGRRVRAAARLSDVVD